MEINGLGLTYSQEYTTTLTRGAAETQRFQDLLTQASGPTAQTEAEIREACESFESYFLQTMFREMRKTSFDENGFIPKSNAEKIFTDLMDEESAKAAAKTGGIGLAEMMYQQMTGNKGQTPL